MWAVTTFPWGVAIQHVKTGKWRMVFMAGQEIDVSDRDVSVTEYGVMEWVRRQ